MTQLARIQTKKGRTYQLTQEDLLWLGRAAQFEGGDNPSATLWAYAQRWALLNWRGSLASLVRAHSQPLNPRWASLDAPGCVEHPTRCKPAALARRRRARTTSFADLRQSIRGLVLKWASAEVPNPVPRAVDFADRVVSQHCLDTGRCSRVVLDARSVYLTTTASDAWPADYVTLVGADGRVAGPAPDGPPWVVIGLGIVGAGAALWWWFKSRR